MVDDEVFKNFNDMFDLDQTQQTVAAKAAKTIVDVSTNTTDPQALHQEQKDTLSVIECNSFTQILGKTVCEKIQKDFLAKGEVCTLDAASDILCAALRADDGVGDAYQKRIADKAVSAGEHTLLSDENKVHTHLFTKES